MSELETTVKTMVILMGLLLTSNVSCASGWTSPLTVTNVETEGTSDLILVSTSGGTTYAPGCVVNNWIFVSDTDARRSRAYGAILAALASGKPIQLWYADTCGTWSYHQATAVMVANQ